MPGSRRFPPPWTVEECRGISYFVRDANNFAVAFVYFESEPGRRAAANLMTKDEARRIAADIAKYSQTTIHSEKRLGRARAVFESAIKHRPRIRLTLRRQTRVLDHRRRARKVMTKHRRYAGAPMKVMFR
jgi:hypothetical protein